MNLTNKMKDVYPQKTLLGLVLKLRKKTHSVVVFAIGRLHHAFCHRDREKERRTAQNT